ncbi:MAG: STAS domain-containing protein [Chitinivibrionales bacterium]|nr:STAS domain-containing protein [Chitinivibrionales bacterium]MBD3395021.1 STAS domain-containing protein [Chitinivibrionales bacterium]
MNHPAQRKPFRPSQVLDLSGQLRGADALHLHIRLEKLAQGSRHKTVYLNVHDVWSMDSAVLGVLVYMWRVFREHDKELVLLDPSPAVERILGSEELEGLFRICRADDNCISR